MDSRGSARGWAGMISLLVIALPVVGAGCQKGAMAGPGGAARQQELADAIHLVLATDREIYTKQVVNRLQNEDKVLKAGEHWKEDRLLPLPAQMFRMGAERVREQSQTLSYALVSLWPINKKNAARTDLEKVGLEAVASNPNQNHYGTETLAGTPYFTAVYPDKAVSAACVDCHNNHPDSPRKDFKVGDVMGAVVVRLK